MITINVGQLILLTASYYGALKSGVFSIHNIPIPNMKTNGVFSGLSDFYNSLVYFVIRS